MMKAKVLAALAATMAVSATCAFAANPFVDVPTDSWAYKSVVELADAGIVQGVDGKYFEGNRNITRYEAAEMVAKAMAHMDRATVEQRALINKLADEYADELNNLGVRVSNLENKVGNIKFTGDARLRYMHQTPYTYDGETQKTEMEIKQITPEEILETKRLEEKIENLTEDEKEKVLDEIIKKYDNGTVTSSIIKNKTFDELKQDMFGKKIIIDVLKNQK